MNKEKFENFLQNKTYISKGKIKHYTSAGILTRISSLEELEDKFNFNIDTIIQNRAGVISLLKRIRTNNLEDLRHTPISNAVRHYYECMTGDKIERIF